MVLYFLVSKIEELHSRFTIFIVDKVTELFCMADDFFKYFIKYMKKYKQGSTDKHAYHDDTTMAVRSVNNIEASVQDKILRKS